MPHLASVVDDIAVVRSVVTDAFNHAPAQLFVNTGSTQFGRPSIGSWVTYGLGTESQDLPGFVVLISGGGQPDGGTSLWGSGFLASTHAGVAFRSQGDPVLYLTDPHGLTRDTRRKLIDGVNAINQLTYEEMGDPETHARIEQYEMAFRMQTSVPELADMSDEPESTWELYGPEAKEPGTFAYNCLMARRLLERGVRFVQIIHGGAFGSPRINWDGHENLKENHDTQAATLDQPLAALIKDLKRRGLLDSTLGLWGGEFGRSPESQGNKGRDHHNLGFTMWMAGGGIKGGQIIGATDAIGLRAIERPMHFRDIHTTLLHQLGLSQDALSYLHLGRRERLTEVHGEVIKEIV